jgi:plastocyanin
MRTLLIASLALVLSACVAAPAAAPTAALAPTVAPLPEAATEPTTQALAPAQPTAAPAAPAPTFERVSNTEPRVAAAQPRGLAIWRDEILRNDAVFISTEDLPVGHEYSAWLSGPNGNLFVGTLAPGAGGALTLTFAAPDQQNVLGEYAGVIVGRSSDEPTVAGSLPEKALVHLRQVLVGSSVTPDGIGFGLGLRKEAEELLRHAQFLSEAQDAGNLPLEKLHAEHIINLIEGAEGAHFGDLNGNGKIENPGDGYGVLQNGAHDGYVSAMRDHAELAASAPDTTDAIKLHAGHVRIAAENTRQRTSEIRDRSLQVLSARSVSETRTDVQKILAVAHQVVQGIDLNGDEQVAPVPGEGGVTIAYQHAQLMAAIPLSRTTPVVTQVRPTPVPVQERAAPAHVRIAIGDNVYSPGTLTVTRGTVVTWSQDGQRPHTVTADDDSFNSGVLRTGATFDRELNTPGTFLYYCELHGGPGAVGMAAQITVQD